MKEFIGIARNIYQSIDEETKTVHPSAELVITVCEPKPAFENGDIVAKRELSDIRFICSLEALKVLTITALEIVESMEKLGLIKKKEDEDEDD